MRESKTDEGEPQSWQFDYPDELWWTGYWLWKMSGYTHLPNQFEVAQYDPRWISDMKLAMWLDNAQGSSPIYEMFDKYMSAVGTRDMSAEEYNKMKETGGKSLLRKK